jgi:hypothetical protein
VFLDAHRTKILTPSVAQHSYVLLPRFSVYEPVIHSYNRSPRFSILIWILASCALVSTAAGQKIKVEFDPDADLSRLRLYQWRTHPVFEKHPEMKEVYGTGIQLVMQEGNAQLMKRGLQPADSSPDVFVTFFLQATGGSRRFAVKTDLALTRRYDILLQELPLLCWEILARRHEDEQARTFTYTEAEMVPHASGCAAEQEARQRKNPIHKSHGKPVGVAWRTPQT